MPDILLSLTNIHKSFGETCVLKGIDLELIRGEFFTLLGSSGCGKTTTLRIIAGLETPDQGAVFLNGRDITALEPNHRNINTVFQNYALFPYYSVAQNVAYGLKIKKVSKNEIRERVRDTLHLVQMDGYDRRMPNELSGGQRQRIAMARAIVNRPDVLLLDEPLGALDFKLRKQMQLELKRLQQTLGITFIYVTHDQEEALNMSDRIGVMNQGNFEQISAPHELYRQPKTEFVADFIGETNLIRAGVSHRTGKELYRLTLPFGEIDAQIGEAPGENTELLISVRPEHIQFRLARKLQDAKYGLLGVVEERSFRGPTVQTLLRLRDGSCLFASELADQVDSFPLGSEVELFWKPEHSVVVRTFEGEALRAAI
jgi:spermidine/putrescine transport system ATP-binding protein